MDASPLKRRTLYALRIGNFKAFGETQTILIKPITLIFGPNSAGKSSIIHSLAFAHEVDVRVDDHDYEQGALDIHRTDIGGSAIDLGGFAQFVHRGDVSNRVEWGAVLDVAACDADIRDLVGESKHVAVNVSIGVERDNLGHMRQGAAPRVEMMEYLIDDEELLRLSRRGDNAAGEFRIDRMALDSEVIRRILLRCWETNAGKSLSVSPIFTKRRFLDVVNATVELVCGRDNGLFPFFHLSIVEINKCTIDPPITESEKQHAGLIFAVSDFWHDLGKLVSDIDGEVRGNLMDLKYLGPLRSLPPRGFSVGGHKDADWLAGGGYAWDVVCKDDSVRAAVNVWLSSATLQSPYRLMVKELVSLEDLQSPLARIWHRDPIDPSEMRAHLESRLSSLELGPASSSFVASELAKSEMQRLNMLREELGTAIDLTSRQTLIEKALADIDQLRLTADEFQIERYGLCSDQQDTLDAFDEAACFLRTLDTSEVRRERKLVLRDIRRKVDVSHRDVGIGISQVLPVLVAALGSEQKLIAMEQPEIHLHPALQAELGDVFIESALGDRQNTFVLETHSEHLILRIMRRIRETHQGEITGLPPITPEDVSILYVEPVGTRSVVRYMPLNELGELIKAWPGGFFEEGLREQFGDA